jgi:hypothetical protein
MMADEASIAHGEAGAGAENLRRRSIKAIALIDDAYDIPAAAEITEDQLDTFWASIENKRATNYEDIRQEFDEFNSKFFEGKIAQRHDLDQDFVLQLWQRRDTLTAMQEAVGQLFSSKLAKSQQLERIYSILEKQLKVNGDGTVEIRTLRSDNDVVTQLDGVEIVFLDYFMGPDNDEKLAARSVERAREIAEQIYARYADRRLPLIILMSSSPSVEKQQDKFRRESKWLNGLFYCVTKTDLEDPDKIAINLGTWIERLEHGTKIQQFVHTIERSLQTTIGAFVESVKNLSLEDYAYIQNLSLAPDGQPLGEYMLWLFSAYLGRVIFEANDDVRKQQESLDRLSFDRLPLNQLMPSRDLIEMYDSALFRKPIGDISKHPTLVSAEGTTGTENSEKQAAPLPYLRLGLLFVKDDSKNVMMVLNPDCDLASTPDGRRPDPIPPVLLIHGSLYEVKNYASTVREPKTDFFTYREKPFHIQWEVKRVVFCAYAEVLGKLRAQGYEPYALLRLPYALQVQRAYAAHFTSIGLPVAPPISHEVAVEILSRGPDNKTNALAEPEPGLAFLVTVRDPEGGERNQLRCRLTTHIGHRLKGAISQIIGQYKRELERAEGTDVKGKAKLSSAIRRLEELFRDFDSIFLRNPSPDLLGKTNPVPMGPGKDLIGICRNVDKENFSSWGNYYLLVNLIDLDSNTDSVSSNLGMEER